MKLETFFEKFDQFADAPGAVEKMRELIRILAVRGELVPQDPGDEPAEECLSRLGLKSTVGSQGADSGYDSLPPAWTRVRFEDVALVAGGVTLGRKLGERKTVTLPYLRVANVKRGEIDLSLVKEVAIAEDEIERYALRENDLLMTEGGDWDKVGRAAIWRAEIPLCLHQNHVFRARMRSAELVPFWFERYFNSPEGRGYFESAAKQTTNLASINMRQVRSCPIPFPPLAEQKRIVAKVDELMALCDRLEAQQQERETRHAALARASLARFADAPTPANLDFLFHNSYAIVPVDLRKSILTLAVQGKLVPQDPNDEPAASSLARITRKKQAMIGAKQVRQGKVSRPHSALDAPTELPPTWEWVNVDALCYKVTDGTHFTPQYAASGVRFVSAKDIVGGKLVFDSCKFITRAEHEQLYRRCNPEYHDIVISKSGSIGTVALVEDRHEFSLFESLALLKFDQESLFPAFLVCALTHACASLTSGHIRGVGVKHLHLDILRGLELALPPLAEQRRIVAKVDQLMALVDALEEQLAASRRMGAELLDAIVAELTVESGLRKT